MLKKASLNARMLKDECLKNKKIGCVTEINIDVMITKINNSHMKIRDR
jgi:hypothetical protein